jgi:hypothetical protein
MSSMSHLQSFNHLITAYKCNNGMRNIIWYSCTESERNVNCN